MKNSRVHWSQDTGKRIPPFFLVHLNCVEICAVVFLFFRGVFFCGRKREHYGENDQKLTPKIKGHME